MNVDIHWLTFTKTEVLAALSALAGQTIPENILRVDIAQDDDGAVTLDDGIALEWQTPK